MTLQNHDERILAIDIGTGTQDIFLYDPRQPVENGLQLVLPSPVAMAAAKARQATRQGRDIFLKGGLMGGWPLNIALKAHLKAGYRVYATPSAARTIHDRPRPGSPKLHDGFRVGFGDALTLTTV